ncbi:MAG: choice-of-anchor D domain-containing protein [Candidatus Electrothrix sp. AU1_5]|nr:choice-of-anchor D domain-containing protein [Candidatus Electrothrix gigas]
MKTNPWKTGLLAAAGFCMLVAGTTQAADIIVDGSVCTLADAITAANTDTSKGGCMAGSEDDTVILQADITLNAPLPEITSIITIEGGGHFISGNNDANVGSVLKVSNSHLTLNHTVVTNGNTSIANGGGIYANSAMLILGNSTVSGNTATGSLHSDGYGGGIAAISSSVVLKNSTVSGNSAEEGGGFYIYGSSSMAIVEHSTISGNSAGRRGGGGISAIGGGSVILNNSTVSENSAMGNSSYYGYGGGISATSSDGVFLLNSTISGNSADMAGGIRISSDSEVILNSSLVSGNTAEVEINEVYAIGTVTADSYNVFGHSDETTGQAFSGFTPGSSDVNATSDSGTPTALDAILSPLADNGGPTRTHALVAGSPAIDLDTTCSTNADQRGEPRPVGAGCDAGSFEFDASCGDFSGAWKHYTSSATDATITTAGESLTGVWNSFSRPNFSGTSGTLSEGNCSADVTFPDAGLYRGTLKDEGCTIQWSYINAPETTDPNNYWVKEGCISAQDIEIDLTEYDFGEVELGSPSTMFVNIANTGGSTLTVSNIFLNDSSTSNPFVVTPPSLPVTLSGGQSIDVEVSYNPSIFAAQSETLSIESDDPDEAVVEVALSGMGVASDNPSEAIQDILQAIEASVANGTLSGVGSGNSAENKLNAIKNMLESAGDLIDSEDLAKAGEQLESICKKVDGQPTPPDFLGGDALDEIAEVICQMSLSEPSEPVTCPLWTEQVYNQVTMMMENYGDNPSNNFTYSDADQITTFSGNCYCYTEYSSTPYGCTNGEFDLYAEEATGTASAHGYAGLHLYDNGGSIYHHQNAENTNMTAEEVTVCREQIRALRQLMQQ